MDTPLVRRNGIALRQLLSRSFSSADEAAEHVCRLVRAELDVDLVYVSHLEDGEVFFQAVHEGVVSGLAAGMRLPANPRWVAGLQAVGGPRTSSELAGTAFEDLPWSADLGLRSFAVAPLWDSTGQQTGILAALDRSAREFNDIDLDLLELLGGVLTRETELDLFREREAARAAQLVASEERYRSLVDDLGDIVVETDALGRMTYVNRAFTELIGMSVEDAGNWDMMAYVHPDDRAIAQEQAVAAMSGADTVAAQNARQVRFLPPDGRTYWMSVRGRSLLDDAGQFAGLRGILHDVTIRVEAEQQVRSALAQAEAALADAEAARDQAERASLAKSQFLSRMSHELRTPLNAILGFSQLLEMGELSTEDAENVGHINRAGRHLLDLINEVLDVVRVEAGVLSLSLESVGVAEVVSESLDLVRTAAAARSIALGSPRRAGVDVVADRQRLKQILVNLLSNAVKYNRDGGAVHVAWEPTDDPRSEAAPHGWVRLSVRDTGRGIAPDDLDAAFTPFERLGAEGSGIEGTGVGLSLTKTLVEALGGRIGVRSEVGEGSTFWVDLPAAAETPVLDPPGDVSAGPGPTRSVLYIEDNPSNITLVRRVLARRPHVSLEVVQDGAEAVEAVQRFLPDLLLLDLHLPGLHGSEILSALRNSEDDRLRNLAIAVVTADLSAGNERRMLEAGATLFLPKPIDVHQLLAVVDEYVRAS